MPGKVLVVDDSALMRRLLSAVLTQAGWTVAAARNGREGVEQLLEWQPDVVTLDINMPDEDGLSVARRLRATGDIPVIMVTAADDVVDRIVGLEVGADDYVTKPFDLRELKARIRAVLRRGASRAVSVQDHAPALPEPPATVSFGRMLVDRAGRRLIRPDGSERPAASVLKSLAH